MIQLPQNPIDDPYVRPGDRPTPDVPASTMPGIREVPDARRLRAVVATSFLVFLVGATVMIGNSPFRNEAIVPGPLSSAHAHLFHSGDTARCQACHPAAHADGREWISAAVVGLQTDRDQSDLCLECHRDLAPQGTGKRPHQVDTETLATIQRRQNVHRSELPREPDVEAHSLVACRDCHKEHRGDIRLTQMTDRQCQSCHQGQFDSFANGHPEFRNGLVRRRSQIAFDHTSHLNQHFPEKKKTFDCRVCHVVRADGQVAGLRGYESSCAQCHEPQVQQFAQRGIDVLALPSLDIDAIRGFGWSVGQWPESATGDFDGPLPPLMRLLLEGDSMEGDWIRQLDDDFHFADIDPDDRAQVQSAVRLAWAIKALLVDVAERGDEAVRQRIATSLGHSPMSSNARNARLVSDQAFRQALIRWMPRATVEVPLQRARRDTSGTLWTPPQGAIQANRRMIQEPASEETSQLLVENPLRGLVDKTAKNSGTTSATSSVMAEASQSSASGAVPTAPSGGGQTGRGDPQQPPMAGGERAVQRTDKMKREVAPRSDRSQSEQQLLVENPLHKWLGTGAVDPGSAPASNGERVGPGQPLPGQPLPGQPLPPAPTLPGQPTEWVAPRSSTPQGSISDRTSEEPREEAIVDAGLAVPRGVEPVGDWAGWRIDHRSMSINYRLTGHADSVWREWADVLSSGQRDALSGSRVARRFLAARDANACRRCHTIDRSVTDDGYQVHWHATARDPWTKGFTDFSHATHVRLEALADCQSCHLLDPQRTNRDTFAEWDATQFVSNFAAITKANCMSCHSDPSAGGACTECHNYHVGSPRRAKPQ